MEQGRIRGKRSSAEWRQWWFRRNNGTRGDNGWKRRGERPSTDPPIPIPCSKACHCIRVPDRLTPRRMAVRTGFCCTPHTRPLSRLLICKPISRAQPRNYIASQPRYVSSGIRLPAETPAHCRWCTTSPKIVFPLESFSPAYPALYLDYLSNSFDSRSYRIVRTSFFNRRRSNTRYTLLDESSSPRVVSQIVADWKQTGIGEHAGCATFTKARVAYANPPSLFFIFLPPSRHPQSSNEVRREQFWPSFRTGSIPRGECCEYETTNDRKYARVNDSFVSRSRELWCLIR